MKNFSGLVVFVGMVVFFGNASAQTITSTQSGSWNDPLTWSGIVPDASNSTAIIINHSVTIPSAYSVSIDQTTISTGASLLIDASGIVTIANGTGNDLTIAAGATLNVSGTLINNNSAVISGSTAVTTTFQSESIYQHQYTTTQGSIPLATWDTTPGAASTLRITGYTTFTTATAAGNWGQTFGNVEWNCASQNAIVNLNGLLTTVQGNLNILSTGTVNGVLRLATTGAAIVAVNENFNVSGGTRIGFCTSGTCIVNVAGNYTQNLSAGYVRVSDTGIGTGTINLTGNFNLQAGILNGGANGRGNINFVGSPGTVHTFTEAGIAGTLINRLAYTVASDNELNVVGESQLAGGTSSFFTLGNNAILRVESTDAAGAIQTGSGQGLTTGNLRVITRVYNAGSQVIYNGSVAQFMGNGQPTVAGITTNINNNAGVTVVAASTLSILGNITLQTGDLNVSNANLTIGGTTDLEGGDILFTTAATARTLTFNGALTLNGNVSITSGAQNANVIFAGAITGGGVINSSGLNTNVTINGSGDMLVPLGGPTSLETVTNNRSGAITFNEALNINTNAVSSLMSITAGNVTINGNLNGRGVTLTNGSSLVISGNTALTNTLTITNGSVQTDGTLTITNDLVITAGSLDANGSVVLTDDLTLGAGTIFSFEDQTVTLNNVLTNNGGVFSANSSSTLNILNTGVLGTIAFDAAGNTLGTFNLNRPIIGNLVTLNSPLIITNALNLLDGVFVNTSGLDMAVGAVVTRHANASITGATPTGGPYDLIFMGGNLTTGVEASGNLGDVTSNSSGVVTLGGAVSMAGNLLISSGTFTSGANLVSALNVTHNGTTFNAPSTIFSIGGNLVSNGAFNRNNGTVDFNGLSTISGSVNPIFQNITISGTLTAPATLNLTGNFINDGIFDPGTGTVVFTNTANGTKILNGTQEINFNNVTIQNNTATPDVSISGIVNLQGVLTLSTTAVLDADGAGSGILTVVSSNDSPTVDGSIAILSGTSAITGNVTVERYMSKEGSNGGRIYRYISAPVQNAPVSDMQVEIPITGSFTGTSICGSCSANQSLFSYDESVITDLNGNSVIDLNDGYIDFPTNANTETFAAGRGYAMFVPGNILASSSALWNLRGPINQGNISAISLPSTFTSSGSVSNDGWNLVGNPYPSTIDWNAASGWVKTNVGGTIHIRDNGTGQFATWNGSVGVNGGSRYIPLGQAFWTQATALPILTANENVKVTGQPSTFMKEGAHSDLLRITLVRGNLRDEAVIHFRNDSKSEYDAETDSRKFLNSTFNLSTVLSTGEVLAINSSPFTCSEPIKLNITNATAGTYHLDFSEIETFKEGTDISLRDNFLNSDIDVTAVNTYSFEITTDQSSYGSNRFSLSFNDKTFSDELQFTTNQVCEDETTSVSILDSESNTFYFVVKDGLAVSDSLQGNGGTIQLSVNKENLMPGLNNVIIQAQRQKCFSTQAYQGHITVNKKPIVEITSGKTCNEGAIELKATSSNESDGFRWYENEGSDIVLSTSSTYTTPIISKSKTYYVSAITSSGCLSERAPVVAEVIQLEEVTISENEDGSLESNQPESNKWFFEGEEIVGENSDRLNPQSSGTYKVEVSVGDCKSSFEYVFLITSSEEQKDLIYGISVFPNPAQEKVYIDVMENKMDIRKAMLYNSLGNSISEAIFTREGQEIKGIVDVDGIPEGVYILRLFSPDRSVSIKIYKK